VDIAALSSQHPHRVIGAGGREAEVCEKTFAGWNEKSQKKGSCKDQEGWFGSLGKRQEEWGWGQNQYTGLGTIDCERIYMRSSKGRAFQKGKRKSKNSYRVGVIVGEVI